MTEIMALAAVNCRREAAVPLAMRLIDDQEGGGHLSACADLR
jgi:hypothetical protein